MMRNSISSLLLAASILFSGCLPDRDEPGPGPNPPAPKQLAAVVMVVDEGRVDPLPSGLVVAMDSGAVQNYLISHTAKAADGKTPESKRYPKKIDLSKQSETVQKLHAATVSKMEASGSSEPFIGIAVTPKRFAVGKIPEGLEADGKTPKLLTLLKKYGGE